MQQKRLISKILHKINSEGKSVKESYPNMAKALKAREASEAENKLTHDKVHQSVTQRLPKLLERLRL